MSLTEVQLYSFPTSPYGMKVACYLGYKKIAYDFVGVSPITFKQIAFADKKQVPLLQIHDEWRLESSEIGLWLDKVFTDLPLLPTEPSEQKLVLEIDQWISDQLIPAMFRFTVDWPSKIMGLQNGWKLAKAVHQATPMPLWVRFLWPLFIRKAKFIVAMVKHLNSPLSLKGMQEKNREQFLKYLNGGPFLGGLSKPSLADFSAFPIIVFPHRFGLQGDDGWYANKEIVDWVIAVQKNLPENPFLVSQKLLPKY